MGGRKEVCYHEFGKGTVSGQTGDHLHPYLDGLYHSHHIHLFRYDTGATSLQSRIWDDGSRIDSRLGGKLFVSSAPDRGSGWILVFVEGLEGASCGRRKL